MTKRKPPERSARSGRGNLSRDDWARAALEAMAEGGLDAVAVEPVAAELGVTKGSFYWHFRHRAALVDAALERWEQEHTHDVIERLEELAEPLERLSALFAHTHAEGGDPLEAMMLSRAKDPQVAPVLRRVTQRRLDYLTRTLEAMGVDAREARYRALFAFQAWIGYVAVSDATPEVLPSGASGDAYLRHVLTTLEADWRRGRDDGDG